MFSPCTASLKICVLATKALMGPAPHRLFSAPHFLQRPQTVSIPSPAPAMRNNSCRRRAPRRHDPANTGLEGFILQATIRLPKRNGVDVFDTRSFKDRLRIPVIAAPMFLVSGPDLVIACCKAGIAGSFPAPNARDVSILDGWMGQITEALDGDESAAPWVFNMVVHSSYDRLDAELEIVRKYKPPLIITALGGPQRVIPAVHDYGGAVFADVNSLAFAKKAAAAGADGLVLVSAGAGGHTGEMSGFAFVDAVRQFFDGPVVLAGSLSTGRAVRAAEVLGADFAYVGTQLIAAEESIADPAYKDMLVGATIEDILRSDAITGVPANWLKPSLKAAGLDMDALKAANKGPNFKDSGSPSKAWKHVWSAGHGVGAVGGIRPVAEIVDELARDYDQARNL